jgi:hypothetical protein
VQRATDFPLWDNSFSAFSREVVEYQVKQFPGYIGFDFAE